MLYTVPHYYNKFKCTAADCQDTCCAGWAIMIDERSLDRYRKTKGPFGNRLKNSIDWKESSFRQYDHRCAFLNDENLCDIYTEAGPDMLCRTCRNYPRHIEEFEGCREISLSLSCMEAAKLILGCQKPVCFLSKEKTGEEEYKDFDVLLYTKLTDIRDLLIRIMQRRRTEVNLRISMCLGLIHDIQTRIDRGRLFEIDGILERYEGNDTVTYCGNQLKLRRMTYGQRFLWMKRMLEGLAELECLDKRWPEYLGSLTDCLYGQGVEVYGQMCREYEEYRHYLTDEQEGTWTVWTEQLMVYFIFTYFCGAVYDERAFAKLKLAVVSTYIIQELSQALWMLGGKTLGFMDMVDIAHRYSREVEHSDENLNLLEKMLLERESYCFDRLLDIVSPTAFI